jgi:catechol 2,3-dioxygenase-like lactoylglutathione lyase family enzyme
MFRPSTSTGKDVEVAEWEKRIIALNLVVGDLERATAFYSKVFGMPSRQEGSSAETAMFRLKDTYMFLHRDEVHDDGPAGDVLELARKGVGQHAIIVEDVDAVRTELEQQGVQVISGPADREWGMRTMTFADPAGHTWEIVQELPSAPAAS